jgi:hypothetical protein
VRASILTNVPNHRTASPSWTVERPSFGLLLALLGSVVAALGLLVLEWEDGVDFLALRHTIAGAGDQYGVLTQVYARALFLPLLLAAVITGLCATAGRAIARVGSGVAGLLIGGWLVGVLIWVETGAVGTDETRKDALPFLVFVALVGVGCLLLGGGAFFDTRAVLARSLAAAVAGLAVVLHVYVIEDVYSSPTLGAWVAVVGFGLLVVAPALPYRRIEHAG